MDDELLKTARKVADCLGSLSSKRLPAEVFRVNADCAAVVVDLEGTDHILTIGKVPFQRNRPV